MVRRCLIWGHQQGEEREVKKVFEQARLHREPPLIDVHRVTDGLEGVERDAHGQENRQGREVRLRDLADNLDEAVGVFVIEQRQQVEHHGRPHPPLACAPFLLVHAARHKIGEEGGGGQQEHQHAVGLVGEKEAEHHHIAQRQCLGVIPQDDVDAEKQHEHHGEGQRDERPGAVGGGEQLGEVGADIH